MWCVFKKSIFGEVTFPLHMYLRGVYSIHCYFFCMCQINLLIPVGGGCISDRRLERDIHDYNQRMSGSGHVPVSTAIQAGILSLLKALMLIWLPVQSRLLFLLRRQLLTQFRDTPTLLHHVLRELFSLQGMSCCSRLWIILLFLLMATYLVSPIDLIPEVLFGPLGLVDDLVSLVMVLVYVAQTYRQDITHRNPHT